MYLLQNKGFSFIESLFAITLIFFIAAYLLPQFPKLEKTALMQRLEMYASEVAFNGAKLVRDYGIMNGQFEIDQIMYHWQYNAGEICVTYTFEKELYERCVSKD
jgi:hypothetical protein